MANLSRKAMPRAAGADAPSDLALPPTDAANAQDRLPHQFVRTLVDSGQEKIRARILRLVLYATIDENFDELNRWGLNRHVAPIGLLPHMLMESVDVRGAHIADKHAVGF